MEAMEYAQDKVDAAKWQDRYGKANDGAGKFGRRNLKLQTFLDEVYKESTDLEYKTDSS